jgi:hypothetical protein
MPGANFMPNEINFQIQLFGSLLGFSGQSNSLYLKEMDRRSDGAVERQGQGAGVLLGAIRFPM